MGNVMQMMKEMGDRDDMKDMMKQFKPKKKWFRYLSYIKFVRQNISHSFNLNAINKQEKDINRIASITNVSWDKSFSKIQSRIMPQII